MAKLRNHSTGADLVSAAKAVHVTGVAVGGAGCIPVTACFGFVAGMVGGIYSARVSRGCFRCAECQILTLHIAVIDGEHLLTRITIGVIVMALVMAGGCQSGYGNNWITVVVVRLNRDLFILFSRADGALIMNVARFRAVCLFCHCAAAPDVSSRFRRGTTGAVAITNVVIFRRVVLPFTEVMSEGGQLHRGALRLEFRLIMEFFIVRIRERRRIGRKTLFKAGRSRGHRFNGIHRFGNDVGRIIAADDLCSHLRVAVDPGIGRRAPVVAGRGLERHVFCRVGIGLAFKRYRCSVGHHMVDFAVERCDQIRHRRSVRNCLHMRIVILAGKRRRRAGVISRPGPAR